MIDSDSSKETLLAEIEKLRAELAELRQVENQTSNLARHQSEERQAAERLAHLQLVTAALARALTSAQVSDIIIKQGVAALGSYAGYVALLNAEASELEIVGASGYPANFLDDWQHISMLTPLPITQAVRLGEIVLFETEAEFRVQYPHLIQKLETTGSKAIAAIPLMVEGRKLGVIALSFATPQKFSLEDKSFMLALAGQCALALERTRLFEAERAVRIMCEDLIRQLEVERGLLTAIVEQMPAGVSIVEAPSGKILLTNQQLERFWGSSIPMSSQVADYKQYNCYHLDGQRYQAEEYPLARAVANGEIVEGEEFRILRLDGSWRILQANAAPVYNRQNQIVAGVAIFHDVTQRKRDEETQRYLTKANDVLASSLDYKTTLETLVQLAVPDLGDICAIDLFDSNGTLQRVAASHIDKSKGPLLYELTERYPFDLSRPSLVTNVLQNNEPLLIADFLESQINVIARDSEHRALLQAVGPFWSMISVPLRARGRTLGLVNFATTNASNRHYTETDLKLAVDLARRAALAVDNSLLYREAQEAVQARENFLSLAAHELKTPITSLRGYAQLIIRQFEQTGTVSPQRLTQSLKAFEQQSQRLARLIAQLLEVSYIETTNLPLELHETDLVNMVRGIVEAFQVSTDEHRLMLKTPKTVKVQADEQRLGEVLANLLDNAIRYSPEGGAVEIEITSKDEETVSLTVTDKGLGIAPEHRSRIFDRFYQAHAGHYLGGMGMGLYISRYIMQLHGGELGVEFPDEGGTRFVMLLPYNQDNLPLVIKD